MKTFEHPGRLLFATAVSLVIGMAPAIAGPVGYGDNTYSPGDTLTASDLNAKFNEIKVEVNDNDARIGTLVVDTDTNTGQIQSLSNGVATNADDIVDLTNEVAANAGDIVALQQGVVTVSVAGFHGDKAGCDFITSWEGVRVTADWAAGSPANCNAIAPIQFPDGVRLTGLKCYFYNADPNSPIEGRLLRQSILTGSPTAVTAEGKQEVFVTPPTTPQVFLQVQEDPTPQDVGRDTVNNSEFAYLLVLDYSSSAASSTVRSAFGCSVSYAQ